MSLQSVRTLADVSAQAGPRKGPCRPVNGSSSALEHHRRARHENTATCDIGRKAGVALSDPGRRGRWFAEPDPTDGRAPTPFWLRMGTTLTASAPTRVATVRQLVIDAFTKTELRQLDDAA